MRNIYYFAYDGDMFTPRLEQKLGRVMVIGTHTLLNYELAFNVISDTSENHSQANIVCAFEDDFVDGVLFKLSHRQMSALDKLKLYPIKYQKVYWVDEDKKDAPIIYTYMASTHDSFSSSVPKLYSLFNILNGAKLHGLEHTENALRGYIKVITDSPSRNKITT